MWTILAILAGLGLIIFWGKKDSPVRGSLSVGIVAGPIAAGVYWFLGYDFLWSIAGKWLVGIILIHVAQELFRVIRTPKRR